MALRIGELAIARRAEMRGTNVAIRDDVQKIFLQLCGDPFGRCYGTELKILEDHLDLGDISFLMD